MSSIEIVPYGPEFREVVRRCLYETGYGGESAEIYFEDPELFADINIYYHIEYEPGSAFVPLVDGEPAGYLLGCTDTRNFMRAMKDEIAPRVLRNIAAGRYNLGPGARRYLARGVLMLMRGEEAGAPLEMYPAHLHIDLFKQYRRFGLGTRLMNTYFDFLRARDIHGVHLGTSSVHVQGIPFYEKLGFRRYAVRRIKTSFFKEISGLDLYNIIYVKTIG